MKVLNHYLSHMSNKRYVYCQIILNLMKKGYSYKQAKCILIQSNILEFMQSNTSYFFHYYPKDWTRWVLKKYNKHQQKCNNRICNIFIKILHIFYKKN